MVDFSIASERSNLYQNNLEGRRINNATGKMECVI